MGTRPDLDGDDHTQGGKIDKWLAILFEGVEPSESRKSARSEISKNLAD